MKKLKFFCYAIAMMMAVGTFTACGGDDSESDQYGALNANLIATGEAKDISYTSAVVLGKVDFSKLESTHAYGVVYMEEQSESGYDYDTKLKYGNVLSKQRLQVTSSAEDGKFEKQITGLKPATRYYYRSYITIGSNYNYSAVRSLVTADPTKEISMATNAASDITALGATLNGSVNIGQLQKVVSEQRQGFIYSPSLSTSGTLTYEYYESWKKNHLETEETIEKPLEILANDNLDNVIKESVVNLIPGKTYYYRSFFSWNGKYFYGKDVKAFTTESEKSLKINTGEATEITPCNATLNGSFTFDKIGSSFVNAGVVYSKDFSLASELSVENIGNTVGEVFSAKNSVSKDNYCVYLSTLVPDTKYYYRAYIEINIKGEKTPLYVYSNDVKNFTTSKLETSGYVDLQLPSGNLWAACNKGASSPEGQGSADTWSNSKSGLSSGTSMPSLSDVNELTENCNIQKCTYNGINGLTVTGTNGKSIFLPISTVDSKSVYYWVSDEYSSTQAYYFYINSNGKYEEGKKSKTSTSYKYSVRPIKK